MVNGDNLMVKKYKKYCYNEYMFKNEWVNNFKGQPKMKLRT